MDIFTLLVGLSSILSCLIGVIDFVIGMRKAYMEAKRARKKR